MVIQHDSQDSTSTAARNDINDTIPSTAERDGYHIPKADSAGYRIREEPFGARRKLRVVLMGAGASTVNFLKKAEEQMQNLEVTVYEKNHDVGGTWLENRYPGCACDVSNFLGTFRKDQELTVADPQCQLPIYMEDQDLDTLLLILTRDLRIPRRHLRGTRFHQEIRQAQAQNRARAMGLDERRLEAPCP